MAQSFIEISENNQNGMRNFEILMTAPPVTLASFQTYRCQITLGIAGSPIENKWRSRKYRR